MVWYLTAVLAAGAGCTTGNGENDLCSNIFEPYPDLITGRVIQARHQALLDGMEAYSRGDHEEAAALLARYVEQDQYNKAAHLYLANSLLVLGKPFDAELQLDHLEHSNLQGYEDQTDWYTVVCWVCSGQLDRARSGAQKIAKGRKHTYTGEATELLAQLDKMAS